MGNSFTLIREGGIAEVVLLSSGPLISIKEATQLLAGEAVLAYFPAARSNIVGGYWWLAYMCADFEVDTIDYVTALASLGAKFDPDAYLLPIEIDTPKFWYNSLSVRSGLAFLFAC
jgi:hypothetical protein